MPTRPSPGTPDTWGAALNAWLDVGHNADGSNNGVIGGSVQGEIWFPPPSGGDDTPGLQTVLTNAAFGATVHAWPGVYTYSTLTRVGPLTIKCSPFVMKRDNAALFGDAGYAVAANFGGTVFRSTATSGASFTATVLETGYFNILGWPVFIGPGSGTSTGVVIGNASHAIIESILEYAVMNFSIGTSITNVEDSQIRLKIQGCTTGGGQTAPNTQNTYWLNIMACVTPWADDNLCIDNVWINPLMQANTGLSANIQSQGTTIVGGHFENASGTRGLDIFGNYATIIGPRFATTNDSIRINAGVVNTRLISLNMAAGTSVIDNGIGTYIDGDTTSMTLTGTASGQVIMDAHQAFMKLPLSLRTALNFEGQAAGQAVASWGDHGSSAAWQWYKIYGNTAFFLRDLVNSNNPFAVYPGATLNAALFAIGAVLGLPSSNTAGRPNAGNFGGGAEWYDTTLNLPLVGDAAAFRLIQTRLVKVLTDAATVAVDCSTGDYFTLTATTSRAIGAPTNPATGMEIDFQITNGAGAAMTTTWNAVFHLAGAWVDPANTKMRTIRFRYNATLSEWVEMSRAAADITP